MLELEKHAILYDCEIHNFYNEAEMVERALSSLADIIVIDIEKNYLEKCVLCSKIRHDFLKPVVIISGDLDSNNRVRLLQHGASGIIKKPFLSEELFRGVLNSIDTNFSLSPIKSFFDFKIDLMRNTIYYKDSELKTTQLEYQVILFFIQNEGKVVSRQEIINHLYPNTDSNNTRNVDGIIKNIRFKGSDELIKTIRYKGYLYEYEEP